MWFEGSELLLEIWNQSVAVHFWSHGWDSWILSMVLVFKISSLTTTKKRGPLYSIWKVNLPKGRVLFLPSEKFSLAGCRKEDQLSLLIFPFSANPFQIEGSELLAIVGGGSCDCRWNRNFFFLEWVWWFFFPLRSGFVDGFYVELYVSRTWHFQMIFNMYSMLFVLWSSQICVLDLDGDVSFYICCIFFLLVYIGPH